MRMRGEITVDLLCGVLKGEVKAVPQTTGIGAYGVLCLPLVIVKGFDFCDERQNRAAVTACS
jgi:hypothetical protein